MQCKNGPCEYAIYYEDTDKKQKSGVNNIFKKHKTCFLKTKLKMKYFHNFKLAVLEYIFCTFVNYMRIVRNTLRTCFCEYN